MPIKAIFFDMDGVLVYSESHHFEAWKRALAKRGIQHNFRFEEMMGKSDNVFAKLIIERHKIINNINDLIQEKRNYFVNLVSQGFKAPPGRNALLQDLFQSYHLILVSNSSEKEVEAVLQHEGIRHYFRHIITADHVTSVKPSPEPYLKALAYANCQLHEAIIIEDSPAGLQAAKNAQIQTLGMRSDIDVSKEYPDVPLFNCFNEIKEYLSTLLDI